MLDNLNRSLVKSLSVELLNCASVTTQHMAVHAEHQVMHPVQTDMKRPENLVSVLLGDHYKAK